MFLRCLAHTMSQRLALLLMSTKMYSSGVDLFWKTQAFLSFHKTQFANIVRKAIAFWFAVVELDMFHTDFIGHSYAHRDKSKASNPSQSLIIVHTLNMKQHLKKRWVANSCALTQKGQSLQFWPTSLLKSIRGTHPILDSKPCKGFDLWGSPWLPNSCVHQS